MASSNTDGFVYTDGSYQCMRVCILESKFTLTIICSMHGSMTVQRKFEFLVSHCAWLCFFILVQFAVKWETRNQATH